MDKIAHFSIVPFDDFKDDFLRARITSKTIWTDKEINEIYKNIELPALKHNAYYIFKTPIAFSINPSQEIFLPLGIQSEIINEDFVLQIFKYNVPNELYKDIEISAYSIVPFFDSFYEGNLNLLLINRSKKIISFEKNEIIAVGIFTKIGYTF